MGVAGQAGAVAAVHVDVLGPVHVVDLRACPVADPDRLGAGDLPARGHPARKGFHGTPAHLQRLGLACDEYLLLLCNDGFQPFVDLGARRAGRLRDLDCHEVSLRSPAPVSTGHRLWLGRPRTANEHHFLVITSLRFGRPRGSGHRRQPTTAETRPAGPGLGPVCAGASVRPENTLSARERHLGPRGAPVVRAPELGGARPVGRALEHIGARALANCAETVCQPGPSPVADSPLNTWRRILPPSLVKSRPRSGGPGHNSAVLADSGAMTSPLSDVSGWTTCQLRP